MAVKAKILVTSPQKRSLRSNAIELVQTLRSLYGFPTKPFCNQKVRQVRQVRCNQECFKTLRKIQRNYLRRVLTGSTVNFRCTKIFFDQANTGLKSSANKKASQGFFFYLSFARLGPFKTILFLSCACGLLLFGFLVVKIKWDSLNNLANKNMEK